MWFKNKIIKDNNKKNENVYDLSIHLSIYLL